MFLSDFLESMELFCNLRIFGEVLFYLLIGQNFILCFFSCNCSLTSEQTELLYPISKSLFTFTSASHHIPHTCFKLEFRKLYVLDYKVYRNSIMFICLCIIDSWFHTIDLESCVRKYMVGETRNIYSVTLHTKITSKL